MVQVKKDKIRNSILRSARKLFAKKGYVNTSMNDIAKAAQIAPSSTYVYFSSKFDLFFSIYVPWFLEKLVDLKAEVADMQESRPKLKRIMLWAWRDLPSFDNVFANNLAQALSTKTEKETYDRQYLRAAEQELTDLMSDCIPPDRRYWLENNLLAHLLMMAQDGFILTHYLAGPPRRLEQVVDALCDTILGEPSA